MSSRKKDNTAINHGVSFESEVLKEELQSAMKKNSKKSAQDFLDSLKAEMLENQGLKPPKFKKENKSQTLSSKTKTLIDDKTELLDQTVVNTEVQNSVTSIHKAKAQALHQSIKRNPSIDLKNADYISFAQNKIKSLEAELRDLRVEAKELAEAGSHFRLQSEERALQIKDLEAQIGELKSLAAEEKKILNESLQAKDTKIKALQARVESLEYELESKYNRLRVRERDLESRLEILKQEQGAVTANKDELILRVKKQNNALSEELEKAKSQSEKSIAQLQEKEEALRRTIKALKLSLTMLESQKQD